MIVFDPRGQGRSGKVCSGNTLLAAAGIKPAAYLETSSVQTAMCLSSVGLGISFMPENYIALFNCLVEPQFCRIEREFGAKCL